MAGEMSQEEMVKKQQLAIAKSMKLKQAYLTVLEGIEDWHIREWTYICAVDGMPAEALKDLADSGASATQIRKARLDYLRGICVQTDTLQSSLEDLQKEVKEACRENKEVRRSIEDGLEDALKKQAQAQAETIQTKDDMIALLRNRISELEKQAGMQQPEDTEGEREASYKKLHMVKTVETQEGAGTGKSFPKADRVKASILSSFRKSQDTKKFIERYIKNENMDEMQKDFLLDCLEEGMSIKEIDLFAAPGLSVDVMRRLKQLHGKGDKNA